jgi:Ca2+/Na+ antiporter
MAKYFMDTEFIEGTQKEKIKDKSVLISTIIIIAMLVHSLITGILVINEFRTIAIIILVAYYLWYYYYATRTSKPTIDLISIGIVAEDGREYYAVSKDFNLEEAWNRYQINPVKDNAAKAGIVDDCLKNEKVYWIRDNVLKPIYWEYVDRSIGADLPLDKFNYETMKKLINKHGKHNKDIAEEIKAYINTESVAIIKGTNAAILTKESAESIRRGYLKPEFYGYYADYDWVLFCWLFGKMIDLPKGFPMYCIDLKQELNNTQNNLPNVRKIVKAIGLEKGNIVMDLSDIKNHPDYPKQTNEHNALADAKWNRDLYKFLNTL